MSAPVPRILMLHGYTQNADIFRKRLSALRKTCGKNLEFVFVDAPIVLHPADLAETFGTTVEDTSNLAALGAGEASAETDDPLLTPRGWWKTDVTGSKTTGMEESLEFFKGLLKDQHFDAVFGFSQGAAMGAILAALPSGSIAESLFAQPYTTPTLHVVGKNDIVVIPERSQSLLDVSENKRVEYHDGGHFVPSKASWRNFLKAWLLDPSGDVPSPGLPAASQSVSGTTTPAVAAP
ncbi:hypothetical protein EWM64_g7162 [Hericium alpestre]|uniref:Serine hydrolase domain-containing protein n=1 Tax=Hericium alpestre TaxID=135208 RepID=A0A4Y9ZSR1_9AGAM|nr:hypothetical protein EWM64_g7162 [Hericium alpestre]